VDELVSVLPAMFALLMTWWAFYPVERLLLEASLIRKLDDGSPVYPPLTRWRYVLVQARMQVLLTLVPVLAIAGISEVIDEVWLMWNIGAAGGDGLGGWAGGREFVTIAAAAGVFLFSPLIARSVLDTQSLPAGPLRETLSDVCRRHRVGVRDLLLWNTNGSMINAAVMGLVAPLRFVLITDALLETLRESEVRAVMAHEVGHVRRRHMVWLILCLLACMFLAQHLIEWPLRVSYAMWPVPASWFEPLSIATAILQLSIALLVFGWVCRRFERQADTFAVQHLSGMGTAAGRGANVSIESVDAMRGALETIAVLNTIDPARHSWRHGSIRWRQRYLDSIIGKPIAALPIDRLIHVVKAAAFLILAAGIAYESFGREPNHGDSHIEVDAGAFIQRQHASPLQNASDVQRMEAAS
ncbi:MAG TPA: M48 family metallopeptidase, partial [Roseiflexaceae bacterium]|nr:M48 family metallopeptidase [Roseiflexaceae bacterium]